ncbi:MAG: energy-coupling factor ABC transporter ATP-binding protein [Candidatus Hodarchaeota archaeon]
MSISFPQALPVVRNLELTFNQGKTYLLTGPSASGKSTLLRFLKGLIPLFYPATITGILEINGKQVTIEEFWDYRTEIGYLFQDPSLQVIGSNVAKDIAFGLENLAIPESIIKQKISEIGNNLNISQLLSRSTTELSGGELALVALASILVLQPQILLLDEFTAYLDNDARKSVLSTIKQLQSPNRIIIVVSHHITEFLPLIDEIIVLDGGNVILQKPAADFISLHLKTIEEKIRIPEFFSLGVNLCENKSISPHFQTVADLMKLLTVNNYDNP